MNKKQKALLTRIILSAVLLAAALLIPADGWARFALFLIPYLVIGWKVLVKAAVNIAHGQVFDENFLMCLATIGAFAAGRLSGGDYVEAVAVMLFYQVGELFESCAVGKSRQSIAELMDIRPDTALVERNGETVEVDPFEIVPGEIIVIRPGDRVALDGTVVEGRSDLDTAALTGESAPREVMEGDQVLSGCINLSGALRVRVDREFGESTVSKILELVEESGTRKAEAEKFITRFARWYTPAVVCAALALAVIPPLFAGQWLMWLKRALQFLVVSCPCALVISIPLSFFGGIGGASRCGVLIKGGNYLETLAQVDTVVFDKTGTLTEGRFRVTAVHPATGTERELLDRAALAEGASTHPIAHSIREACGSIPEGRSVSDIREVAGQGVVATVDGRATAVGNARLMESVGADWSPCEKTGTIVYVAVEGVYQGHIVISDAVKSDAAAAIGELKALGVKRTVMLTGDTEAVGREVAKELGIDEAHCGLLPADKVAVVERLLAAGSRVAFAGDGINDAPVLSRADIGIAMGAAGSDAAIEAADVVLMNDRPSSIATAMRISRKTHAIVRQNIAFALVVKFLVLALSAFGLVGMWAAVFGDVGVSVICILNAMRALRFGRKE